MDAGVVRVQILPGWLGAALAGCAGQSIRIAVLIAVDGFASKSRVFCIVIDGM